MYPLVCTWGTQCALMLIRTWEDFPGSVEGSLITGEAFLAQVDDWTVAGHADVAFPQMDTLPPPLPVPVIIWE